MRDVFLRGVGAFVPDNFYTNDELSEALGLPVEKGRKYGSLLGVKRRPVCVDYRAGGKQIIAGEEMAHRAALSALRAAEIEPDQLDAVLACSSFFDYIAPPVSSRLLKLLGLGEAMTFDLIGGCAEFLHGLHVAANMIRLGQADHVLVTSSEVIHAFWRVARYPIEWFVFGDTGGAAVLSAESGSHRLVASHLATRTKVGSESAELICVPITGSKEPVPLFYEDDRIDPLAQSVGDVPVRLRLIHNIKQVALGAPRAMIDAARKVLAGVDPKTAYLVPHQASIGVLSALSESGIPADQIGISLPERGNMSTSSIPVTLSEHWADANQQPHLVMASVGVGMSFGAALFERTASLPS